MKTDTKTRNQTHTHTHTCIDGEEKGLEQEGLARKKKQRKTRKSLHDEQKQMIKWNKKKRQSENENCLKEKEIEENALEGKRKW